MKLMTYKSGILSIFLFMFLAYSCREDSVGAAKSEIEKTYLDDYESPKEKWGYIDLSGNKIIDAKYDDARDFSNELAAVNYKGKWGYINSSGKTVIKHLYKQTLDFNEERSFVQTFDSKWMMINSDGDSITYLNCDNFKPFKFGYAAVANKDLWGIIDTLGEELIPMLYQSITSIDGNSFIYQRQSKWGILSFENEKLVDLKYSRIYPPVNGYIRLKDHSGVKLLNIETKEVSQSFELIFDFYYDLTIAKRNIQYVLINSDFDIIKKLDYEKIEFCGSRFWKYKQDGKWGVLDDQAEMISEAKFDILNRFNSNKAAFMIDDEWGYVNSDGSYMLDPLLPLAWDFKNGFARVVGRSGYGMIDTSGSMIILDEYRELRDFYNGFARYQTW